MDSTIFDIDTSTEIPGTPSSSNPIVTYNIPSLSAYAIDHSDVLINGLGSHQEGIDYEIQGNQLIWNDPTAIDSHDKVRLVIHYHGIRDYRLLFPNVSDPDLVERLANFYEEAEKDFRSAAWLSYALMCGAIFEGLLYATLNVKKTFIELIQDALASGRIDLQTSQIMDKTRNFRNLVHANKYGQPYITRADAMDIRTVMDKLIKSV
jgi:hypothetical protein